MLSKNLVHNDVAQIVPPMVSRQEFVRSNFLNSFIYQSMDSI